MSIRRFALAGVAALTLGGAGGMVDAAPSLAGFGYTSSPNAVFGQAGSGNGQLSEPFGVAVDEASGDVYVADSANNRVEEFDASGSYIGQFGGGETPAGAFSGPKAVAVDNSSGAAKGDVYVNDVGHSVVDVFTATGKYVTQLTDAGGAPFAELLDVAVGASGEVWVYDSSGGVYEFSDTGALLAQFNTGRGTELGLAVDSAGSVYLLFGCGCVGKYRLTGPSSAEPLGEWGSGSALAVSLKSNNVFLDERSQIQEYGPFGEPFGEAVDTFADEGLSESQGLAVNGADGTVYATQRSADSVAIFKAGLLANATTGPASGIGKTAATISGTVGREGLPTKYHFQYGETTAYGSSTPAGTVTGEEEELTASLSSLTPGTTYHYRIVAENANGATSGNDQTFTLPPAVDDVQTEAASGVAKDSATLHGSLSPDGADAHYYFQYGETSEYGSISPALPGTDAGSASKAEPAETTLTGLLGSTTYHYRIVAVNSFGTTYGEDMTFTTLPAVDDVQTEAASAIGVSGATLNGSLSPDGTDAHYYFQYGETSEYGTTSPAPPGVDAGSASKPEHAQTTVGGLYASTTYHYRIVANSSFGTTDGEDETFTTLGVAPTVDDQPPTVTNVLRASVLVHATINDENSATAVNVEYVAAAAYVPGAGDPYAEGSSSQSIELQSAHGDQATRPLLVSGLLAGTTYHYRIAATDATGTAYGPDYTFTTAAPTPPALETAPASSVTTTTAVLSGVVAAQALQTSYEFEVGTDTSYSGAEIFGNAGQSAAPEAVSANLQFLVPGTTYHYRLIATNVDGTTYGPDMTFTTPGVAAPIAQPPATPLISVPTFQFPNTSGAITKPVAKAKKTKKKKTASKRKKANKRRAKKKRAKR
ncbi:MAG TPA: hypothetical protein VGL37_07970 [Solirubrobacteraceae bacterium]